MCKYFIISKPSFILLLAIRKVSALLADTDVILIALVQLDTR